MCGHCELFWDRFCTLGRAPCTKETPLDFHEWCRVTRHPQIFRRLTGCQRDTSFLGRHRKSTLYPKNNIILMSECSLCFAKFDGSPIVKSSSCKDYGTLVSCQDLKVRIMLLITYLAFLNLIVQFFPPSK